MRELELQWETLLLAGHDLYFLAAGDSLSGCGGHSRGIAEIERPFAIADRGFPRIVEDDELLFDRFARLEVVVLAGEPGWLTRQVREQRPVVADQGQAVRGRSPVRRLEGHIHAIERLIDKVRAEAGRARDCSNRPSARAGLCPCRLVVSRNAQTPRARLPKRPRCGRRGGYRQDTCRSLHDDRRRAVSRSRKGNPTDARACRPSELLGLPAQVGFFHFAQAV